jgi:hypothetical protein
VLDDGFAERAPALAQLAVASVAGLGPCRADPIGRLVWANWPVIGS